MSASCTPKSAFRFDNKDELGLNAVTYAADAQLVSRMRLVLAVSVLLAVLAEPSGLSAAHVLTWLVFAGYPQYTRPAEYKDWPVPEILLSGHHAKIEQWKRDQRLARTRERRPDLLDS